MGWGCGGRPRGSSRHTHDPEWLEEAQGCQEPLALVRDCPMLWGLALEAREDGVQFNWETGSRF